jgi:predicted MFS family arabinose efflux permease
VIDISRFRNNRCFSYANADIMIFTTSTLGVIFLFSFYLQYITGFDPRSAGLILLASTLIMALLAIYVGRLSDRINLYYLGSIGVVLSLLGLVPMVFISSNTSLALAVTELVLVLAGGACFYPPLVKIILGSISRDSHALGSSLAETMRLIGNACSMALVTIGFTLYLGDMDITPYSYARLLDSMKLFWQSFQYSA